MEVKVQPNFSHYVKKVETQATKLVFFIKKTYIAKTFEITVTVMTFDACLLKTVFSSLPSSDYYIIIITFCILCKLWQKKKKKILKALLQNNSPDFVVKIRIRRSIRIYVCTRRSAEHKETKLFVPARKYYKNVFKTVCLFITVDVNIDKH